MKIFYILAFVLTLQIPSVEAVVMVYHNKTEQPVACIFRKKLNATAADPVQFSKVLQPGMEISTIDASEWTISCMTGSRAAGIYSTTISNDHGIVISPTPDNKLEIENIASREQ